MHCETHPVIPSGTTDSDDSTSPLFADIVARYIREVMPLKRSKRSPLQQLRFWVDRFGSCRIDTISPKMIADIKSELMRGTVPSNLLRRGSTVNRYLAILSAVFTAAIKDWFLLKENPALLVRKAKESRGRCRYLSDAERSRLLKALEKSPRSLKTIVILAIYTGMRAGEILNLHWHHVDLQRGLLQVPITKTGRSRSVALVGPALEAMGGWKTASRARQGDLVFPGRNRLKALDFRTSWRKVCKRAKLEDMHFHDLRHTAASYLAMSGSTPQEIAEVLGHASLQMVARYAHMGEGNTRTALSRMATQFSEKEERQR